MSYRPLAQSDMSMSNYTREAYVAGNSVQAEAWGFFARRERRATRRRVEPITAPAAARLWARPWALGLNSRHRRGLELRGGHGRGRAGGLALAWGTAVGLASSSAPPSGRARGRAP